MKRSDHEDLFKRYQSGEATPEEQAIVEDYILNNELNPLYLSEAELEEMTARLGEKISKIPFGEQPVVPLYRRWKIAVAAAAVAAIVFGVYFFNAPKGDRHAEFISVSQDIAPGKNGATITLANGKVIQLSDAKSGVVIGNGRITYSSLRAGEAAKQSSLHDEVASIPRNDVMQMTAATARGQTYQFTLPDGTKVWLNADSKLEFPSNFVDSKTRNVKLSGEGYFEVAKDKLHRFIVATDKQELEVLGTHFNINSYADEAGIKTTLLEGSVRVYNLPEPGKDYETLADRMVLLKPNQQSVLTASNRIDVKEIDPEAAVAWKNNKFMFDSQSITDIMRMVSRWYNVEVIYTGALPTDKFWGSVSRFDNVSKVLKALESTNNVHFKIEGRRIYVSR